MEHVFPDKPQTAIAHLPGSGATTRDSVQGVLVASPVLIPGYVPELSDQNALTGGTTA